MPQMPDILRTIAGLAITSAAQAQHLPDLAPAHSAGTLYVNLQTGERALTRYASAGDPASSQLPIPEFHLGPTLQNSSLFDYWSSLDPNPCWDSPAAAGFTYFADRPIDLNRGITEPIAGFDFGDLPFDSQIHGIVITVTTTATESVDSNNDGTPDTGIDSIAVFYDALSESNRSSIAPPTAAVRIGPIPGDQGEFELYTFSQYELILDFGGDWFELGDSDAQSRGPLWLPGANPGQDVAATEGLASQAADGLADFQYLQYYAQHDTNDKVTDVSTFIGLAAPSGEIFTTQFTTFTLTGSIGGGNCPRTSVTCSVTFTVIQTYLVPDPLPQGQSAFESFGVAALGPGADTTNLDWSVGDCCFWFGGLDCAGFLDQLNPDIPRDQSWFNFTPYAQNSMGLLSNEPPNDCTTIDFARDGILDNADIQAFVKAFLFEFQTYPPNEPAPNPPVQTADLNADGIADNADIAAFIERFLACTG